MSETRKWWAKGTLFENCNCQIVCTGHFHFTQLCTHERCIGYWGIQFEEGEFEGVSLTGAKAVVLFDTPQNMASGDWIVTTFVDNATSAEQQAAIERIVTGEANGPWKILAQFVGERRPTRREDIVFTAEAKTRTASVGKLLQSTLGWLKGRDRERPVTLENSYNQIHAPSQILAMGSTTFADGGTSWSTSNTHALSSSFSWAGEF